MSNIKMNFNTDVARKVGTDAAIILSNIEFWQATNKANGRHFHDGHYWTYNSVKAFNELFDYLSEGKIRRCLDKLEQEGYLISANYNQSSYDRTKWYCSIHQLHLSDSSNGIDGTDEPIPDNKPNEKPDSKQESPDGAIIDFDWFWSKYPKKSKRKHCNAKFDKLSNSKKLKIYQTLEAFLAYKPFPSYNHPDPMTYLNQERWEDELPNGIQTTSASGNEYAWKWNTQPRKTGTKQQHDLDKKRFGQFGFITLKSPDNGN